MEKEKQISKSEALEEIESGLKLLYFEREAFDKVREALVPKTIRASLFADLARFNVLYMITRAGSGHIGSSFSSIDILSWLMLEELDPEKDRYFSSKGHDCPALYSVYAALGRIPFGLIHRLRRLGGLPGHPDVRTPGCLVNTGSLGMGISKAKGFVLADRLKGEKNRRVFVMTGDGELQEGQIWESLVSAANMRMDELTVIVDHNKVQSDARVRDTSDLGDLEAKFSSFGWEVRRCNGHDFEAMAKVFSEFRMIRSKPKVLIADTIKGKGVSFMEHTTMKDDQVFYKYHSGAPSKDEYLKAAHELKKRIDEVASKFGISLPEPKQTFAEPPPTRSFTFRLIPAYSEALIELAERNPRIVALDADLILDTGLIPFRERFPERFIECGIAEQDMVSEASALALSGFIPVVHSFACFLTGRAHEQIYNACTEGQKIIYVGSLAGLLPGGPGHSHQAVYDIASMAVMPNMTVLEPATPRQVKEILRWCIEEAKGSSYIRLVSIPCERRGELEYTQDLKYGMGEKVREGRDVVLITYGPVMLVEALKAADLLLKDGIETRVINLPWLNRVDKSWLEEIIEGTRLVVTIDNHYLFGGLGYMLRSLIGNKKFIGLGLEEIPACGRNDEVLRYHGLDGESIAVKIKMEL